MISNSKFFNFFFPTNHTIYASFSNNRQVIKLSGVYKKNMNERRKATVFGCFKTYEKNKFSNEKKKKNRVKTYLNRLVLNVYSCYYYERLMKHGTRSGFFWTASTVIVVPHDEKKTIPDHGRVYNNSYSNNNIV